MNNCLKELREKQNLTQAQVAKEIGITQQAYSLIEKGDICPSLETAMKISKYFKKQTNKIFSL